MNNINELKVIGISSDGLIKVYEITENRIKFSYYNEQKIKNVKLYYDVKNDVYFKCGSLKYYLNEIMRIN